MKRILLCLVFVFFVGGVIWFAFSRRDHSAVPATRLAPANSIFFVECRDFTETQKRFSAANLARILDEPSVKRFISYSSSNVPAPCKELAQALAKLSPISAFFSSYTLNRDEWICGVHCSGDLRSWENQLAAPLAALFGSRFRAFAESDQNEFTQTQSAKGLLFGLRTGSWLLFSPKPVYLQDALRRTNAVDSGLDTSDLFLRCRNRVSENADFYGFATGDGLRFMEQGLKPFLPRTDVSALIFTAKIEGSNIHDTVFAYCSHPPPSDDFDRKGLFLTTDKTLLYVATSLDLLRLRGAAEALSKESGIAETAKQYLDEVNRTGVDFAQLSDVVKGVELVLNRVGPDDSIVGAFLVETKDGARANEFLKMILEAEFSERYRQQTLEGLSVYNFRNREGTALVLGMMGQDLIATTTEAAFVGAVKAIRDQKVGLPILETPGGNETGQGISGLRLYVDTPTLFDRGYSMLRPVLVFGSALVPNLDRYLDPTMLPEAPEISSHLSPIMLTRREVSDGILDESTGSLTAYEVSLLAVAGAVGFTTLESEN
ncbi:MAG TPA: hypothetical protein VN939_15465 [Chthoniobacterales bacterium]|nr:hypothetical protein [Chthoniobacterales bacterium]